MGVALKCSTLEESVRNLEMQISHYQAKVTEADHRVSDAEETLANTRSELAIALSDSSRLKRDLDSLTTTLTKETQAKAALQDSTLRLEQDILALKTFQLKLQGEK